MEHYTRYFLPAATFLLLTVFFLLLPPLRSCRLVNTEQSEYRLTRADALIMAVISLLYAAVAFHKLGNIASPDSFVDLEGQSAELVLTDGGAEVTRLMLFPGVGMGRFEIEYSPDGVEYRHLTELEKTHGEVFKWIDMELPEHIAGGRLRITGSGNVWLGEVVARTAEGETVPLTSGTAELCDEQALCPEKQNFFNSTYFDEIYHARTAWEHLHHIWPYEITHPPLGKSILAIGIALFGTSPFGWRFSGTFLGVLMLPILYVFAKKLFGGRAVPAAVTMLTATDFMHFVQTRIATIDVYAVFFILLMYLFMYLFVSEGKRGWFMLSGLCFGLGAASKWTCIYAGAGLAVIWAVWVIGRLIRKKMDVWDFVESAGYGIIFFICVPALVYYLSYLPYGVSQGHGNILSADYMRIVLDNQKYMFSYHADLVATHPYSSHWYQWLLDIRPILYYLEYFPDGKHSSFGAFVNPVLCWGGLMSLFVLAYLAMFRRDRPSAFLLVGYLAQLLPWVAVTRLTFAYHYFPCTVFLALALGCCFRIMRLNDKNWRLYTGGFVALSLAVFVLFYPALSGKPVGNTGLLSWLPTWPF